MASSLSADSGKAGGVQLIFGSDIPLAKSTNNRIEYTGVNGTTELDQPTTVYRDQDTDNSPFIDFDYEFNRLLRLSRVFAASGAKEDEGQSAGVVVKDDGDQNHLEYDVSKAAITYPMRITKLSTNATSKVTTALPGAEFAVDKQQADGSYVPVQENGKKVTVTTGDDGSARYAATSPGTYAFIEIKAPDGYTNDPRPHTVNASNRDATYIKMSAATAMGTSANNTASNIVIKGIDANSDDPKETDTNPGPIIINVDCSDYDITKPYKFPNLTVEDSAGKAIDDINSRVLWNFYNVPSVSPDKVASAGLLSGLPDEFKSGKVLVLGNDTLPGTVIAPEANVVLNTAKLAGMIAANNVAMMNTSSERIPLDFPLFDAANDIQVSNLSYADTTKSLEAEKTWQSLPGYTPTANYPDVEFTLLARVKGGDSKWTKIEATKQTVGHSGQSWTATYPRLPVYAPDTTDAGDPPDKGADLIDKWVTNYYDPYLAGDTAEQAWLSSLKGDKDHKMEYSILESHSQSENSQFPYLDTYLPTVSFEDNKISIKNQQYGLEIEKYAQDDGFTMQVQQIS